MSNPSRGERFILDLSDDEDNSTTNPSTTSHPSNQPTNPPAFPTTTTPDSFLKDIIERTPSAPKPPSAPVYKQTPTGFPVHKKRSKVSAFKAARGGGVGSTSTTTATTTSTSTTTAAAAVGDGQGGDKTTAGARGVVGGSADPEEEERRQIDLENQRKIAEMSTEEIEQERAELLAALDPALVAMLMKRGAGGGATMMKKTLAQVSDAEMVHRMKGDLEGGKNGEGGKREVGLEEYLKRANIDDGRGDTWVEEAPVSVVEPTPSSSSTAATAEAGASVAATVDTTIEADKEKEDAKDEGATKISKPKGRTIEPTKAVHWLENDEAEPKELPDLQPASSFTPRSHTHPSTDQPTDPTNPTDPTDPVNTLHFPRPPTLPDLDPSSPNFLTDLHTAYFPSLPTSPSTLAWLAPLPTPGSPADLESSYSPSQPSIPASSLRFDFRGQLLPPRISRAMPTDRGLHHHADAPEAAGYTIPELARLMRSSVPQQRGVAVQTLGRVLYRLGRGEWGVGGEMGMGMWRCVEEGEVVGGLVRMAGDGEGGEGGERHRSVRAYATEAVWLWRMGGGKVMGAI